MEKIIFCAVDLAVTDDIFIVKLRNFKPEGLISTAWKMYVFGVFLVCFFHHSDWIRRHTPYLSVFSPNTWIYGPENLRIRTLFTQCSCQQRAKSPMLSHVTFGKWNSSTSWWLGLDVKKTCSYKYHQITTTEASNVFAVFKKLVQKVALCSWPFWSNLTNTEMS